MKIRIENYDIVTFTVYSFKKTQNPKKETSKFKLTYRSEKYFDLIRQMITRTVL